MTGLFDIEFANGAVGAQAFSVLVRDHLSKQAIVEFTLTADEFLRAVRCTQLSRIDGWVCDQKMFEKVGRILRVTSVDVPYDVASRWPSPSERVGVEDKIDDWAMSSGVIQGWDEYEISWTNDGAKLILRTWEIGEAP